MNSNSIPEDTSAWGGGGGATQLSYIGKSTVYVTSIDNSRCITKAGTE